MKRRVYQLIGRTSVGHRAICDQRFRIVLFTGASLLLNLVYGIYNGVLGVVYGSSWFGVLCAYYLTLCAMRCSVMPHPAQKSRENYESNLMIFNGIVLILLAFVLACIVLFSLLDSARTSHSTVAMIGIAAYTFYMTVLAVINFLKAHQEKSALLITVRNISLAAATASMMTLERSMISTFSQRDTGYGMGMDACTGAGGFLIVLLLGVSMIILGAKRKKNGCEPE